MYHLSVLLLLDIILNITAEIKQFPLEEGLLWQNNEKQAVAVANHPALRGHPLC